MECFSLIVNRGSSANGRKFFLNWDFPQIKLDFKCFLELIPFSTKTLPFWALFIGEAVAYLIQPFSFLHISIAHIVL